MVVRAKIDTYNSGGGGDDSRVRYMAVRVADYDVKEDNKHLLERLKMYSAK